MSSKDDDTRTKIASAAAKVLTSRTASKAQKSLAASALTQRSRSEASKIANGLQDALAFTRIQALIDQCEADIREYDDKNGLAAPPPSLMIARLRGLRDAQALFGVVGTLKAPTETEA